MHRLYAVAISAALLLITFTDARADGNAVAGQTVFAAQCSSCHTTTVGRNGFGPSLAGVIGRRAGSLAG